MEAVLRYTIGPLYYVTNLYDASVDDAGYRCCPHRFDERSVGGIGDATKEKKTTGTTTRTRRRSVVRKKHGLFCNRALLVEVLEKKISSLEQVETAASVEGEDVESQWMFMVVELRYNKMLSAWVEASRGVVR